jgi:hypothetical protein
MKVTSEKAIEYQKRYKSATYENKSDLTAFGI